MSKQMLIDAAHPEETRVAIIDNGRLTAFEFDAGANAQLTGNIYLARVSHVEPALQAAFVDYGGERDGFLALSDIHPDYYQIPDRDRQALLHEDRQAADADREREDRDTPAAEAAEAADGTPAAEEPGQSADEEKVRRPQPKRERNYAIQEVIKRRQVLLVQIYREPRGNKGAALTTYLSLAGRYCVLAPNTARGGGVSRKINTVKDRARLREIVRELEVAPEHGVIVRTAGSGRTKAEIKRDYAALLKLWEEIRTKTLESYAPCRIHEESNLIRRAIRDLYDKDITEIQVDGDDAYRDAKQYMRLLMPSHAKNIKPYKEKAQIFIRHKIESQLDALFVPEVRLPSGGWIIIEPVEALTSIDVNSGRSTKDRNVESTALRTNLESAEEIARQLQLRDTAGLIVIDFIDMDVERNRRAVETRLKECLKSDRARVQVGRISGFGLLEMSRQRLKKGMLEMSTEPCPHCDGSGHRRTDASLGLAALRRIEEQAGTHSGSRARLRTSVGVANFLANAKRATLGMIEERHGVQIEIEADTSEQTGTFDLSWRGPTDQADSPASRTDARDRKAQSGRGRRGEPAGRSEETREARARDADADRPGRRRRRSREEPADGSEETRETRTRDSEADADRPGRRRRRRSDWEDPAGEGEEPRETRDRDSEANADRPGRRRRGRSDWEDPAGEGEEPRETRDRDADSDRPGRRRRGRSDWEDPAGEGGEPRETRDRDADSDRPGRRRRRRSDWEDPAGEGEEPRETGTRDADADRPDRRRRGRSQWEDPAGEGEEPRETRTRDADADRPDRRRRGRSQWEDPAREGEEPRETRDRDADTDRPDRRRRGRSQWEDSAGEDEEPRETRARDADADRPDRRRRGRSQWADPAGEDEEPRETRARDADADRPGRRRRSRSHWEDPAGEGEEPRETVARDSETDADRPDRQRRRTRGGRNRRRTPRGETETDFPAAAPGADPGDGHPPAFPVDAEAPRADPQPLSAGTGFGHDLETEAVPGDPQQ